MWSLSVQIKLLPHSSHRLIVTSLATQSNEENQLLQQQQQRPERATKKKTSTPTMRWRYFCANRHETKHLTQELDTNRWCRINIHVHISCEHIIAQRQSCRARIHTHTHRIGGERSRFWCKWLLLLSLLQSNQNPNEPITRFLVTVCLFALDFVLRARSAVSLSMRYRAIDAWCRQHVFTYWLHATMNDDAELNANKYFSFSFISFFSFVSFWCWLPFTANGTATNGKQRWARNRLRCEWDAARKGGVNESQCSMLRLCVCVFLCAVTSLRRGNVPSDYVEVEKRRGERKSALAWYFSLALCIIIIIIIVMCVWKADK